MKRQECHISRAMLKCIALILFAVLSVSGCSLHDSKIEAPLMEVPSSYSTEEKKPAPPLDKWWEQFEDKNLNTLMEKAFSGNLDIAGAYERLQQSLTVMRITDSSGGLMVNVAGSGGRNRRAGAFGTTTEDTFALSAAASYEIDIRQKLRSKTKAARFDALALEQELKALYMSISANLADLYYLAVEQRAQLELSSQTIASFQDTSERVERRYRGGLVPAIDVYQSRQNLAAARARRPLFESNLSVTLNALSILTGRFPDREIGGSAKELKDAPAFETGLPSQLISRRPDVNAALLRLKASDERIGAAIADRFPSFNLTGSYSGASDKLRTVLDSPNIFWNILIQAAQPVFDAGRRKAEVDRSKAVFRENLAGYHKAVLNAFKEVEDSLAKISASKKRIRMLDKTVSASESTLRLALDRYMQGLSDYLPVLTEQLRFLNAKSNLLAARRRLISDSIELARALGGNWVDGVMEESETVSTVSAD